MKLSIKLFFKAFYFIIFPGVLLSYLLEPFTSDVRIYLGAAKVAALTPGFPMNLDSVWESRFIGHRFLYYFLNLIDPFEGWLYSIWMKFIVAVITLIILYYFSMRVSEKMQVPFHYPFIIGFLGLFAINNFIIFSAEYQSVVIAILMITFLLDDRKGYWFLAGLLILPLGLLKGLPILLVPIVMLAVIMLVSDYKPRFYWAFSSLPIVASSGLIMILYFPHFISDIYLLARLGHLTRLGILEIFGSFFNKGIGMIGFAPLVVIGLFTIFLLLSIITKDQLQDLKLLLSMWIFVAVYVLIISEFFYYHYYLGLIPAILTICYFLKWYPQHELAFGSIVLLVLVIFAAVVSGWSWGLAFKGYTYWSERDDKAADILSRYDLLDQPVTLYLDNGEAGYYFPTRSACRYPGSLPPVWNVSGTVEGSEIQQCSLDYTGKYVVALPLWIDLNVTTHSVISDKVNSEYTKVYSNHWDIYQKRN